MQAWPLSPTKIWFFKRRLGEKDNHRGKSGRPFGGYRALNPSRVANLAVGCTDEWMGKKYIPEKLYTLTRAG